MCLVLPSQQIKRIVNFALESGYRNLAAFVPDNYFGKLAVETSKNAVLVQGKDLSRLNIISQIVKT